MDIRIKKLAPSMADDFFRFFDEIAFADHPEWGCGCYCCFFHAADAAAWEKRTEEQNQADARAMILAGQYQGLLAYIDGVPSAWCHFDRKDKLPGIGLFFPDLVDSNDDNTAIAAVVCFTVAQGCRGHGVAGQLLAAACEELASQGFRIVEAYPQTAASSAEEHYHGPLSMYLNQGFQIVRTYPEQTVVRKQLPIFST